MIRVLSFLQECDCSFYITELNVQCNLCSRALQKHALKLLLTKYCKVYCFCGLKNVQTIHRRCILIDLLFFQIEFTEFKLKY